MSSKMFGFWNSVFHATFGADIEREPLADEEVLSATVGGLVTAYLRSVAASPKVMAIISIDDDGIISASIVAQVNGTVRNTRFNSSNEKELTETSVMWANEIIMELGNVR